jgi:hypothetical protein
VYSREPVSKSVFFLGPRPSGNPEEKVGSGARVIRDKVFGRHSIINMSGLAENADRRKQSCYLRSISINPNTWPDVQLVRHSHEFSKRFGVHFDHHAGPVNFDGLFAGAELGARLFVE